MTSTRHGSPVASIFQQWTAQQLQLQLQRQSRSDKEEEPPLSPPSLPSSSSSYRILLQTSYSLLHRIAAAEPVDNPQLYRRAGVPTPAERAVRDIAGGAETAWLLRLVGLAAAAATAAAATGPRETLSHDAGPPAVKVVYVVTQPRGSGKLLVEHLPQDLQSRIRVLDLASTNPWGWDSDDEEADGNPDDEVRDEGGVGGTMARATTTTSTNMKDVTQLYRRLHHEMMGTKGANAAPPPVILIWQSLTPLIAVHGFDDVHRLVAASSFPAPCLQVWPVQIQTLTPGQHMRLEDAANALLCLEGGEMTMIRQGVRERGNVVRERLPFRLVALPTQQVGGAAGRPRQYRIVEGEEEEGAAAAGSDLSTTDEDESSRNGRGDGLAAAAAASSNAGSAGSGPSRSHGPGRPRVHLRLEDDDTDEPAGTKGQSNVSSAQPSTTTTTQPISRPRIYLQDDDPEFDDLDEEDPDDDLDI